MKISIITPIYQEASGLSELFGNIVKVVEKNRFEYEIIAVNDGSNDGGLDILKQLASGNKKIKVISFRRNYGQTSAISAGIAHATGDVFIPIDSDLENDPSDIVKLMEKIAAGYDVVSGWRKNRWHKKFITRKIPSISANWIISRLTGIKLHDYGCTLKAYKREVIEQVHLYGEMHRFIPVYASLQGAKIAEVVVNYQTRKYGKSNYNLGRVARVLLDLLTVLFLSRYFTKPMHFFGKFGILSLAAALFSGGAALYLKYINGVSFILTPLPLMTVFLIMLGIQFVLMGLLAEILIRVYYETNNGKTYVISEKINFVD